MVLLVLGLAVAGICLLIWRPLGDWCFENALPYEQNPPSLPREGLLAVLMVFFMTMGLPLVMNVLRLWMLRVS